MDSFLLTTARFSYFRAMQSKSIPVTHVGYKDGLSHQSVTWMHEKTFPDLKTIKEEMDRLKIRSEKTVKEAFELVEKLEKEMR